VSGSFQFGELKEVVRGVDAKARRREREADRIDAAIFSRAAATGSFACVVDAATGHERIVYAHRRTDAENVNPYKERF